MTHFYNSKSSRFSYLAFFNMTAILLLWCPVSFTNAQSPIAVLENADGDTVLASFSDGALLLPGELGTGNIPVEGPGVRMMWYPTKAAFRAGGVASDQWSNDYIGEYSSAFGLSTTASGDYSTAFGYYTEATGDYSTASGYETKASGQYSTAFGFITMASGSHSTAFGRGTIASTSYSLSIGQYNDSNQTDDGTLFVIGNGIDDTDRSDAFRVNNSGQAFAGMVMLNSDRRLKENIEHLDPNTLDKLTKISAVRYRFKDQQTKPQGDQIGLIAQEVQMHFPELVTEGNDGYLSVSYNNFTAVLLKGLQEQQKQLEEKDEEIRLLKEKIQRLDQIEERLARLENQVPNTTEDAE